MSASKPDPRDFVIAGKKDEKIMRKPGQIRGYDFSVESCERCQIYLVDNVSQIFIDDCKDCTNCDILLQIPGHPIVESSMDMLFGPLTLPRAIEDLLAKLMSEAGLTVTDNEWKNVFDFSKGQEPFPSDRHWREMSEQEVQERFHASWVTDVGGCLGIDNASPGEESEIEVELEEVETSSESSVGSSVGVEEGTLDAKDLCEKILTGYEVDKNDVRKIFAIPLTQGDKDIEELLLCLRFVRPGSANARSWMNRSDGAASLIRPH
ncbi:hypothetical protein FOL47_007788 [Perkinsus chesapeaki]|uniref:CARP motif domain-containing protein n=1 Tax=Perkinsus chesapeaki TaxID=330153 RepID=A0A7J6LI13_PERCH|nr:hypothetical protein FOL47_007788 [Perkinsus chesapeaki]